MWEPPADVIVGLAAAAVCVHGIVKDARYDNDSPGEGPIPSSLLCIPFAPVAVIGVVSAVYGLRKRAACHAAAARR